VSIISFLFNGGMAVSSDDSAVLKLDYNEQIEVSVDILMEVSGVEVIQFIE
jgi:hypothetical protein